MTATGETATRTTRDRGTVDAAAAVGAVHVRGELEHVRVELEHVRRTFVDLASRDQPPVGLTLAHTNH